MWRFWAEPHLFIESDFMFWPELHGGAVFQTWLSLEEEQMETSWTVGTSRDRSEHTRLWIHRKVMETLQTFKRRTLDLLSNSSVDVRQPDEHVHFYSNSNMRVKMHTNLRTDSLNASVWKHLIWKTQHIVNPLRAKVTTSKWCHHNKPRPLTHVVGNFVIDPAPCLRMCWRQHISCLCTCAKDEVNSNKMEVFIDIWNFTCYK